MIKPTAFLGVLLALIAQSVPRKTVGRAYNSVYNTKFIYNFDK